MSNFRTLSINLDVAKEWYQKGGDLKSIALQVFKEFELQHNPKSWEEFCQLTGAENMQYYNLPNEIISLMKLVRLRDYYCKGCEYPSYGIVHTREFVYNEEEDSEELIEDLSIRQFDDEVHLLMFPNRTIANEFLTNFKGLIISAMQYI